jgi:ribosome-associated translation inhibitor RaiA
VDVVITHGRKIVSDEVRALTQEKVRHIGEHCPGLDRAEVHFSEERNPRISDRECCEVVMSGHGQTIRAKAAGQIPLIASAARNPATG